MPLGVGVFYFYFWTVFGVVMSHIKKKALHVGTGRQVTVCC